MKKMLPVLCAMLAAWPSAAQTPGSTFEVVSVKKLEGRPPVNAARTAAGVFTRTNVTLAALVQFAYNVLDFEIVGGPGWIREDRFDVDARAAGDLSAEQMRPLVRALLEDRFKLVARREQREMRHSALVMARDDRRLGAALKPCVDSSAKPDRPPLVPRDAMVLVGRCQSMAGIAKIVATFLQTPVLDRTSMDGTWDFQIAFADPRRLSAGGITDPNVPSLATVLQEELGLKLESMRGPVDVVVIESVQQPTEN